MLQIELAALPDDTPLRSALAVMHWSRRSGVVTVSGDEIRLIRTADILRALKKGSGRTIGELSGTPISTALISFESTEVSCESWKCGKRALPSGDPWFDALPPPWSTAAGGKLGDYALVRLGVGSALVLTKSEKFAQQLEIPPKDCYCNGPRQHEYDDPHAGMCDKDQETIECYR
ncbi:MAG TPA: hypothetical protein VE974_03970 [Thermoanaerobaculia bacterium]|nr:hypothetical protein [Thermoanaerobaculia bacterium]